MLQPLAIEVFLEPLQPVLGLGNQSVLFEVFYLEFFYLLVVFLSLLFEVLNLSFKGTVFPMLKQLYSILLISDLTLKILQQMVFETQFMLHLGNVTLVSLLAFSQFILQTFDLILFLLKLISEPKFQLLLHHLKSLAAFLPLLTDSLL